MHYAEIILPVPLPGTFTYIVPEGMAVDIQIGMRASVPFGPKKIHTGIIAAIHQEKPTAFTPKAILALPDEEPMLREPQLQFWNWLSEYYMANFGEIYQAAVPAGFKTDSYKPKTETYVRLTEAMLDENALSEAMDKLKRANKQLQVLMQFLACSHFMETKINQAVLKRELMQATGVSASVFNALVDKEILESFEEEIGRLEFTNDPLADAFELNSHQHKALSKIEAAFKAKNVVLLHGVTSSGKTEIYIDLIQKTLSEGKQVLYLAPEIALTAQLRSRLQKVFGNHLGVYHSKFSDAERVEIWNNILHDESYEVILGVRSSIFLPFRELGLIIVDEEHDASFKQFDRAPFYHARNAAIVLAQMHGAKTWLGTATPSIESYYNTKIGKYALVELNHRHGKMQLPNIELVDMKEAYRKKQHEGHLSDVLLDKIKLAISHNEQVILFQNRRGYAPYVECKACAHTPTCRYCDVSLTYHARSNSLHCHYCGYTEQLPQACPNCHQKSLDTKGFGTEKVAEEIKLLFPEARVARMDLDTTRTKRSYEEIIASMEKRSIDILIGTQMVTKGLDFEKVSLVGILNADNLLNFPDFRSHERAFQLLSQVSGRAGRKHKKGTVVIQTYSPNHPIITQVLEHDYASMFQVQIRERQDFKYPPFYRMIQISLRHRDFKTVDKAAQNLTQTLRGAFGSRVLGPVTPAISRIQNQYIRQILFKFESSASVNAARNSLLKEINELKKQSDYKYLRINCDVDPY